MDYAFELKYFHEASNDKFIIPINVSTEAKLAEPELSTMEDQISEVLHCNKNSIDICIQMVLNQLPMKPLTMEEWINSGYAPTLTIIEAAQALYRNHSVKETSRTDAGAENFSETTDVISRIIDECKKKKKKAICFVTGVP